MKEQDALNQGSYLLPESLKWFETLQGFCDPGERAAYWRLVDEVRGQPILDLGVGAGRTVALLRPLTERYTAIDYLPEMVETVRRRYPFVDIALGDARDLSRFADHSFAMVAFSFNGIDSIDHQGRLAVMAEVRRVLRPGGIFWFSTLNQEGPSRRQRPWRPRPPSEVGGRKTYPLVALRGLINLPRSTANYLRAGRLRQRGDGWEISTLDAHSYGLMVHYTTLRHQLDELTEAGFLAEAEVFGSDGLRLDARADLRRVAWFQILARR